MTALKSYYEISPFFFVITASATFLYMTMNFLMLVGGGDHSDFDSHDGTSDLAFKFFSTQTILAFFMGFGWSGITATIKWKLSIWPATALAVGFGFILMSFSAFLLFQSRKLNHTTKIDLSKAIGAKAMVYSRIPLSSLEGSGRIQVVVSGTQRVVSAVSVDEAIDSFSEVEVIGLKDKDTLIVKLVSVGENR